MFAALVLMAPPMTNAYGDGGSTSYLPTHETIFVIEVIRNGASSHSRDKLDSNEFFGVPAGHLTNKGRSTNFKIGGKRRNEYHYGKQMLAYKYNANAILSLSSHDPYSSSSSHKIL